MGNMKILISPMNWGFGHAGRMIPMALELKKRGCEIIFAADKSLLPMLEKELPGITLIAVCDMDMRYSRHLPQYWSIFVQIPMIIISAFREHSGLKPLVRQLKPDIIISDNRLGFWHKEVFCVYITHQLRLRLPRAFAFLEPVGARLHRMIINHYDLCLVPDLPGSENLSGWLSHGLMLPDNVMYIGPLSRFSGSVSSTEEEPDLKLPYYCIILSGPEPQRSLLFEKIAASLKGRRLVVMSGSSVKYTAGAGSDITLIINPGTKTMKHVISGSELVITRSGYTSVMELVSLGKGAVLIPTPGQTEQEYLGIYLDGRYGFVTLKQNMLNDITAAIERSRRTSSTGLPYDRKLFDVALDYLFEQVKERCGHHCGSCQ
jgi:UDP:flavonoid glycosyltransferase YjiC (YdhE family)